MTFQNSHVRFYVSLIGSGEGRHTTHLLKCVLILSTSQTDWKQSSDILSDISFDILSDIYFDILSDISSDISSDILSDISFDILSDILFFLTFFLTYLLTRNPAPVRAYFTIRHDFYPRTPCSMLCSQALCAGAGYQSFNFFAFVTNISYQC